MEKSHFALAVVWRRNPETNDVEFLVLDSVSTDHRNGQKSEVQVKFPGGMNRVPDEPVSITVQRELVEETYLSSDFEEAKLVWEKDIPEKGHKKSGFLVPFEACSGELRTEVLRDNGDEMSPPRWVDFRWLAQDIFYTHQGAYYSAVRELQNQGVL